MAPQRKPSKKPLRDDIDITLNVGGDPPLDVIIHAGEDARKARAQRLAAYAARTKSAQQPSAAEPVKRKPAASAPTEQPAQPLTKRDVERQQARPALPNENVGRPGNAGTASGRPRDRVPPHRERPDAAAEAKGPANAGRAFFQDGGVFVEHNTAPIRGSCGCGAPSPRRCTCIGR